MGTLQALLHPGRIALVLLLAALARAETVPNPAFDEGDLAPTGWTVSGAGDWRVVDGNRVLTATGTGQETAFWISGPVGFAPSVLYRLRFRARRLDGPGGGTATSGTAFANRDLGALAEDWRDFSSYFVAPVDLLGRDGLRFGLWHLRGTVAFDDLRLDRVQPVHRRVAAGIALGEGEQIAAGHYAFRAPQRTILGNYSRPLEGHDAGFNTHRWTFAAGQQVTWRHEVGGRAQRAARVAVNVNYHTGGRLLVEAQAGAGPWTPLGQVDGVRSARFDLPAALLPAPVVRVRLRAQDDPGSFQVDDYAYEADLDGDAPDAIGVTRLVTVTLAGAGADCAIDDPGALAPGVADTAVVVVRLAAGAGGLRARAVVAALGAAPGDDGWTALALAPGEQRLRLPYRIAGTGDRVLHLQVDGDGPVWRAEADVHASVLHADGYGERLGVGGDDVAVWWASSGWKVSATRPAPTARGAALRLEAARNETEAAQLVLRPRSALVSLRAVPTALGGPGGSQIPAAAVEVFAVGTVPVRLPTDATGEAADWPDPLLPVDGATVPADRNRALWVRVRVPPGTPAGSYTGAIALRAEGWQAEVPVAVEVWDFDLPEAMTCQTAFGFSPAAVWQYQRLESDADRRAVLGRYLDSFARHHISPYDPAPLDPPRVTWPDLRGRAVGADEVIEPHIDWSAWDAAMARAIDGYHFNTFRVSIPGLGGGTYRDRREPALHGWDADTPQYRALLRGYGRALERHLAEKGWLDEAYVYWFDEPAPQDYEFVMAGFERLKDAAPGIARMLTEQVEPALIGGPNLWCPVSSSFQEDVAPSRMAAGESFWWYICTVPKAPYATAFIDHAGTELRAWLWQTWQRGIEGILVWTTNYWTSGAAYADGLQDPYADPMSWESTANAPVGTRRPWGNGDGRFLYPPRASVAPQPGKLAATAPILEGPVESVRWEMLRDGIEDYEYLALLRRALADESRPLDPQERARWTALLVVPPQISTSLTAFATDPAPIEARRREVARALEALGRQ